jgi:hypothetical protein
MNEIITGFLGWLDGTHTDRVSAMYKLRESQVMRRKNAQTRGCFVRFTFRLGVRVAQLIPIADQSRFRRLESLKYYGFAPL